MQPETPGLLWDAQRATGLIGEFVADRTWQEYESDAMLRSAVERQFQIIGEALNKLSRLDPSTAAQISDLPRIVAFRNVLVHGYAVIDNELVWEVATTRVVLLATEVRECSATAETARDRARSATSGIAPWAAPAGQQAEPGPDQRRTQRNYFALKSAKPTDDLIQSGPSGSSRPRSGGQGVAGSNPVSPTDVMSQDIADGRTQ